VNICILAAGAAGMYCGSCMRDNALAGALKRMGHGVTLLPLYTPLKTEPDSVADADVFFGGINVYLQHASRFFRKTPRAVDWLLDRPWLLKVAGDYGAKTPPEQLAGLTLALLQGERGPAVKELRRLLRHLKDDVKPEVVTLPNLMFLGTARAIRDELNVPIVCELTGEDIFLDAMGERDRGEIQNVIRERAGDVTRYVATCDCYAGRMAEYAGIPRDRIDVVYPGIPAEYVRSRAAVTQVGRPPTIGYMARVCPEKGFDRLLDALLLMPRMPGMDRVRLKVAGYVGKGQEAWYAEQQKRVAGTPLAGKVEFGGEVDRDQKIALLDGIDVLCVPTGYPEAKGIFVLEALARGTPVVQPAHGSFPELIQRTGGGVLVPPGDAGALAAALAELLRDAPRRQRLGEAGRQAVKSAFLDTHMAGRMLEVFERATRGDGGGNAPPASSAEESTMTTTTPADAADEIEATAKTSSTPLSS
jgi:glycosyltransferase involved in cell wall biosynthesis